MCRAVSPSPVPPWMCRGWDAGGDAVQVSSREQPRLGSASPARWGWRGAEASQAAESCCSACGGGVVLVQGCGS